MSSESNELGQSEKKKILLKQEQGEPRNVGTLEWQGVKVFTTKRKPKHYFKKFGAVAIGVPVVEYLIGKDAGIVRIIYEGKEKPLVFEEMPKNFERFQINKEEGFERQYIIPMEEFKPLMKSDT